MIRLLLAILLTAGAASVSAEEVRLKVRETTVIDAAGATAAYAVDTSLADVSLNEGKIRIYARRAGRTAISVINANDVLNYDLLVEPAEPRATTPRVTPKLARATADIAYDSAAQRLTSGVSSTTGSGANVTRFAATGATHMRNTSADARTSLPSVSLQIDRGARQFALFDQHILPSGLLRGGRNVRGLHYRSEDLELHGGLVTTSPYRNFLLSPDGTDRLLRGTYRFRSGGLFIMPSATWHASDSTDRRPSGIAPSVRLAPRSNGGPFQLDGEVGYRDGFAGAASMSFDTPTYHLALSGDHVPARFPLPAGGPPQGSSFRGDLAGRLSPSVSLNVNFEGTRQFVRSASQRTGSATSQLKVRLNSAWALTGGASVSAFDDDMTELTSVTVPVGFLWNASHGGASGQVRYQQNTTRNRGGAGGLLRVHANTSRLRINGSVDYQRDAATIDLVFRESPELRQLFDELELSVRTPEELSRLMHSQEYPALSEYLLRASPNLSPWRLQLRADARWDAGRTWGALSGSLLSDRTATSAAVRDQLFATVAYTRALVPDVELRGTGTWSLGGAQQARTGRWTYSLGIRVGLNGTGGLLSVFQRQVIRGRVFRDESASGLPAAGLPPLAAIRMVLDGTRYTTTDENGVFVFTDVGEGVHRVEAILPAEEGFRFTTPASIEVSAGQTASFALGRVPARLYGYVRDDVAAPITGVQIALSCGERRAVATTDTQGRYTIDGQEGSCVVEADAGTLPPGYQAGRQEPRSVQLASERPAHADYVFRAMRSIVGRVPAEAAGAIVTLRSDKHEAVSPVDATGRFAFRNLQPDTYTLSVSTEDGAIVRRIELAPGPALVDVDLKRIP